MERLSDTAIEIVNELHRERLDYHSEYLPLVGALYRLAAYEDTGLEPEEIEIANKVIVSAFNLAAKSGTYMLIERLQEIICAEAEGRLLVLPCKPMTTVYVIEHVDCYMDTEACPMLDESGRCNGEGEMPCPLHIVEVVADIDSLAKWIVLNAIGKTVFRTREEAEVALRKGGDE